ncbi:RAD23 family protein [Halorientalis regularis]|uniref:Dolichyl-phosphate-mannose-protein mannosyltransferase n=1 Tax=Halorientalis regularis TaxID=660518 RepID=A0A1G7HH79_9EURY|nr:hypothetical protein [Halorientalis regularis]SDE99644.1 hypothetical protein SAMN05216218_10318 [Halorientalis regularis]
MTRLSDFASTENQDPADLAHRWRRRLGRALFGDRYGVVLFLGTLAVLATYWRVGVFLTDSYAIANGLVNVADGNLEITKITYSLTPGSQPGLWYADGAVYARNYAHIFLSLPVLWVLDALAALFDLRLVLAAAWSGIIVLLFDRTGRILDRHQPFAIAGAALALVAFLASALVAAPLPNRWTAFLALQITGMLAVAFAGVVLYRVLTHAHGRRVGLVFGAAAVVASPVSFWASIPKRHALSGLAVVAVLGAFYFSRAADTRRRALGLRALAYAVVALWAWLHALEALVVFAVLIPTDLATARSNHPKHLAVVTLVFLVALTPFLATNAAINGDPFQPPRSLDSFSGQVDPLATGGQNGGDSRSGGGESTPTPTPTESQPTTDASTTIDGTGPPATTETELTTNGTTTQDETGGTAAPESPGRASPSDPSPGPIATLLSALTAILGVAIEGSSWAIGKGWSYVDTGITLAQEDPDRLYHTFLRSGRIPEYVSYRMTDQEAIDLALLEVAPLLGGLLGVLGASLRRLRTVSLKGLRTALGRPTRQTDLLAVAMTVALVLMNVERLPLHTQITVRYLVPIVPLGLYGVARLGCVQRAVNADLCWLAGAYVGGLVVGGLGFLLAHLWLDLALGEAMQLHALVNLAGAGLLAIWAVVAGLGFDFDERVGVVALAIPAALSTLFLLFTGLVYFQYADYALPLVEALVGLLPIAV